MAHRKPPLYTLAHGIEVVGEYAPRGVNRYWRVRVRAHPFFDGAELVRRNRAVMSAHLGRKLREDEHVHHANEDRGDDRIENLHLIGAAEHNRHHKTGTKHRDDSKARTSASLKAAYADGRKVPTVPSFAGKRLSNESRERISESRKRGIAEGRIAKLRPPAGQRFKKGYRPSDETRQRMSESAKRRWSQQITTRSGA